MARAESEIRKAHRSSSGTERLVNAARLAALEKNLGVEIKRHRDPGNVPTIESSKEPDQISTEDETVFIGRET